ncbi:MAG: mycofactocin radical SAM maturase [Desulforhopalus sp.]
MSNRFVEAGIRAPVNVTWEVTLQCNLRCSHCLSASGSAAPDELSTDEALDLVKQFGQAKVFQINFGGGEPFIRKDFMRILEKCHALGIKTCISTNGTLLDENLVSQLAENKLVAIQVSMDGATESVCDQIRGKGTYIAALRAIKLLAATPISTSINTVLTNENAAEIPALHNLADSLGVSLRVSRFRPSGRGAENWQKLRPSEAQLLSFAEWLDSRKDVRTGDSFFSLTSQERQGLGLNLCGAAKLTCCVGPNGNVYPCAFLQQERFLSGSVRSNSFQAIWDKNPVFDSLRKLRIHSCEDCTRFDQCHGGCPAVAYHLKNDISVGDPECLHRCVTAIENEHKQFEPAF